MHLICLELNFIYFHIYLKKQHEFKKWNFLKLKIKLIGKKKLPTFSKLFAGALLMFSLAKLKKPLWCTVKFLILVK